jgi:hypothetical protein
MLVDIEADRGVQRGSEVVREEDRRAQRQRVVGGTIEKRRALEDQVGRGEIRLLLEQSLSVTEEALLIVDVDSAVPRDHSVAELMRLGEPRPPGGL